MRAGKLNHLVQLQHRKLRRNEAGEQVAKYVTYATVWAEKSDQRSRKYFSAKQVNPELQVLWTIYWRDDVGPTDRLIDDRGVVFEFAGPPSEVGRREGLDLLCKALA